jgi:hypothetical protein
VQGCRGGVTAAVDWFFTRVPAGIVLEDDCLPHPAFSVRGRTPHPVRRRSHRHVSATNPLPYPGPPSYHFSRYNRPWDWATWARARQHNDLVASVRSPTGGPAGGTHRPKRRDSRTRDSSRPRPRAVLTRRATARTRLQRLEGLLAARPAEYVADLRERLRTLPPPVDASGAASA